MSWTNRLRSARERAEAAVPEIVRDERLLPFIQRVNPRFRIYDYHTRLIETMEAFANREIENLMVLQPPGTSKSELASRLLPAYLAWIRPRHTVGIASYGALLAHGLTRDARAYYEEAGGLLDPSQKAKSLWKTFEGGSVWGAGVGGAIRGFRYCIGVTDDPHKDIDSIRSAAQRERVFRWWDQTWMNRLELFSSTSVGQCVVMQRLADNDLAGFLLGRPDADKWTVQVLDAVRDCIEPLPIPDHVKVLPDPRSHGELLCPEILPQAIIDAQMQDEDSGMAQYQQRPRAQRGQILDSTWFRQCWPGEVPEFLVRVIGIDLAVSSKQSADYTAAFPVGVGTDGSLYIHRPYRDKKEAPVSRAQIASLIRQFRPNVTAVESVAFQLAFTQELRAMPELYGHSIIEADADRDKESRARGWSHLAFQGRIVLVDDGSNWIQHFLDECKAFPGGRHDDQIDAVGIAIEAIRKFGGAFSSASGPPRGGFQGR